jgi:hypothetical protein
MRLVSVPISWLGRAKLIRRSAARGLILDLHQSNMSVTFERQYEPPTPAVSAAEGSLRVGYSTHCCAGKLSPAADPIVFSLTRKAMRSLVGARTHGEFEPIGWQEPR